MSKLIISIFILLAVVYASLALKCYVTDPPHQLRHPAVLVSGMRDHILNNLTKMRNSTNRANGGNEQEEEFTTYCLTMKCHGETSKWGLAYPGNMTTDYMCQQINQQCTKKTGDPHPACKLCTTDDCNNEEQQEERPAAGKGALNTPKKSETLKCFVTPQQPARQHLPADAVMSRMPDHYLDNFTKMRNSTSSRNNGGGGEEDEFTTYCMTMKCQGETTKWGIAWPVDMTPRQLCLGIKWACKEKTGDKHPYCKMCNTDDCNNELEVEEQ